MAISNKQLLALPLVLCTAFMLSACEVSVTGNGSAEGTTTTDGSGSTGGTDGGDSGSGGTDTGTDNGNTGGLQTTAFQQDGSGLIAMEAENFDDAGSTGSHAWTTTAQTRDSSTAGVQVLPNNGERLDDSSNSAELSYQVNFNRSGTHYIWVRMYSDSGEDNSLHVGLDGVLQSGSDKITLVDHGTGSWEWTQDTMDGEIATLEVDQPGLHTLNVWMREDGAQIDKILVVDSSSYSPTGTGPAESARDDTDSSGGSTGGTDTGGTDNGGTDNSETDGGGSDTGGSDGGSTDNGGTDNGGTDGGNTDGGSSNSGSDGVPVDRTVSLNWNASGDSDVKGYYVYHGTVPDQYTDKVWVGNSTFHAFNIDISGDHFFAVTAVNQSDVESGFSAEASVSIVP